jgi:hypothetical protein
MQRPFAGKLSAAGGLVALVIGLCAIDDRVRDQFARLVDGRGPSPEIATVVARLQDLAFIVIQAVKDQSIEHAPLVIFGLAAMVLVLLMLRT